MSELRRLLDKRADPHFVSTFGPDAPVVLTALEAASIRERLDALEAVAEAARMAVDEDGDYWDWVTNGLPKLDAALARLDAGRPTCPGAAK